jgi:hypothetical protein
MNAPIVTIKVAAGCLAATLLAACASSSDSPAPADVARPAISSAAAASAKLAKGLTGPQVRELLGAPAATKPLTTGGVNGQIWSYPFRATEVKLVAVGTQDVAAVNPLNGQNTSRTEPVYQNQTVDTTDTLHLLMVDDRLIEWRVVRDEKSQFH